VINGHLALAFVTSARTRDGRMAWLLAASFAPDLLDAALARTTICNPFGLYSHSVPAILALSTVAAVTCWSVTRDSRLSMACLALGVVHLPLDLITGSKAWWPFAPLLGFDLYQWPTVDITFEVSVLAGAWWYARRTLGSSRIWRSSWFVLLCAAAQGLVLLRQGDGRGAAVGSPAYDCQVSYLRR
jgi:hypothetical protein